MAKKYIDADALYETMCALWDRSDSEAFETEVFKLVQDAPAADVVEARWIPVTERLPEEARYVLVSSEGVVSQDCLLQCNKGYVWASRGLLFDDDAWMPLPEPYQGEPE